MSLRLAFESGASARSIDAGRNRGKNVGLTASEFSRLGVLAEAVQSGRHPLETLHERLDISGRGRGGAFELFGGQGDDLQGRCEFVHDVPKPRQVESVHVHLGVDRSLLPVPNFDTRRSLLSSPDGFRADRSNRSMIAAMVGSEESRLQS